MVLYRYLFLFFSAMFSFLLATDVQAKISPRAFKGITQHFQQGKEFYSPVLGQVALETGLIANLRFYGNFDSTYKGDNTRDYISDHSKDPLWNLVKTLFPSPAGSLAVETTGISNFAKHVREPEVIAYLLNFAYQSRQYLQAVHNLEGGSRDSDDEVKDLREGEPQDSPRSKRKGKPQKSAVSQPSEDQQALTKEIEEERAKIAPHLQQINDSLNELNQRRKNQGENQVAINQENQELIKNKKEITKELDALIAREKALKINAQTAAGPQPLSKKVQIEHLQSKFQEHKRDIKKAIEDLTRSQNPDRQWETTLLDILSYITKSIEQEINGLSFYPIHTTEQVILAFFCEKFDTQGEIWALLKALDNALVHKENLPPVGQMDDLLKMEDLDSIVQRVEGGTGNLDDFFALANAEL